MKMNLGISQGILKLVRNNYTGDMHKTRKLENIRKFFDISPKGEYTLDNQTWEDLDLDRVYEVLDRNYSSLGESALYHMLRNPLMDEQQLIDRSKFIKIFKENDDIRDKLLTIYFNLNKDRKNSFLDMIEKNLAVSKVKYYFYTFIGKVVPLATILLSFFVNPKYMVLMFLLSLLTVSINSYERNTIKSNGILYLARIIKAAKKIRGLNNREIQYYTDKISSLLKEIKSIDKGTRFISFANMWEGVFETISIIFLLEESAYYDISDKIKKKKSVLMDLYYTIGELEALISIASYQHNLKETYVEPKFIKEVTLNITEGTHPLIEGPVPNSITIDNKGIVLTGTNMSGKSTFLRMLGINILLAQSFYFVLAKDYQGTFFNIVSSISPSDDITKGKSYYMAEAEAILRIIKALDKKAAVFCPIDEIFRGTNPVERIAMSAEILTYLNNRNTISIVATHDRELVDILRDKYEFYYFSEDVDNKKGLSFDYKLKKGVSQTRNAIRLLEYIGYPEEIVESSYKRAGMVEGFI